MGKCAWEPLDIAPEEFLMSFFEAEEKICFQILDDRPKDPDHTLFTGTKLDGVSGAFNSLIS